MARQSIPYSPYCPKIDASCWLLFHSTTLEISRSPEQYCLRPWFSYRYPGKYVESIDVWQTRPLDFTIFRGTVLSCNWTASYWNDLWLRLAMFCSPWNKVNFSIIGIMANHRNDKTMTNLKLSSDHSQKVNLIHIKIFRSLLTYNLILLVVMSSVQ